MNAIPLLVLRHFPAFLALSAGCLVASAADLVLVRPDGNQHVLALGTGTTTFSADVSRLIVATAANTGQPGDGWCTSTAGGPLQGGGPRVTLRLPDGRLHDISVSAGSPVRWLASQQRWLVSTRGNGGVSGDGWCPATIEPPRFIVPLTASPTLLASGQVTTLQWEVSGVTSCSTAGTVLPAGVTSLPGWQPSMTARSSGTRLNLSVIGDYRFRLTCANAAGQVSGEVLVQVSGSQPIPGCTGNHLPPTGRTRQAHFVLDDLDLWLASNTDWPRYMSIDLMYWSPPLAGHVDSSGVHRGFPGRFGHSIGDTGTMEINTNAYAALRFDTTGHALRAGQISWEQAGTAGAPLLVTLSPCPGDFFPSDLRCRSNGSAASGLGWTTGVPVSTYCPLVAGQAYYLNVIFGTPANPGATTCHLSQCRWLFSQSCQANCLGP